MWNPKRAVIFIVLLACQLDVSVSEAEGDNYVAKIMEDEELFNWEAPEYMRKSFPYYWSGFDEDGVPFWVGEVGRWDVRKVAEAGTEVTDVFEKYIDQLVCRVLRSINDTATQGEDVSTWIAIGDLEDYDFNQLASLPTVALEMKIVRRVTPVLKKLETAFVVNTNFVAERLVNLMRPILGPVFEKLDIYGTNKAKWIPTVLKRIPASQLPEWYGGTKNFVPIKVYG